jgi:hypothetical protein
VLVHITLLGTHSGPECDENTKKGESELTEYKYLYKYTGDDLFHKYGNKNRVKNFRTDQLVAKPWNFKFSNKLASRSFFVLEYVSGVDGMTYSIHVVLAPGQERSFCYLNLAYPLKVTGYYTEYNEWVYVGTHVPKTNNTCYTLEKIFTRNPIIPVLPISTIVLSAKSDCSHTGC